MSITPAIKHLALIVGIIAPLSGCILTDPNGHMIVAYREIATKNFDSPAELDSAFATAREEHKQRRHVKWYMNFDLNKDEALELYNAPRPIGNQRVIHSRSVNGLTLADINQSISRTHERFLESKAYASALDRAERVHIEPTASQGSVGNTPKALAPDPDPEAKRGQWYVGKIPETFPDSWERIEALGLRAEREGLRSVGYKCKEGYWCGLPVSRMVRISWTMTVPGHPGELQVLDYTICSSDTCEQGVRIAIESQNQKVNDHVEGRVTLSPPTFLIIDL